MIMLPTDLLKELGKNASLDHIFNLEMNDLIKGTFKLVRSTRFGFYRIGELES